ncbi:hypothetical protein OF83DRAFT_1178414 [Amylostereum chailletii]|nr:hypothetical protein OF83DRAFT_1178414 [Amylostereum chailletii]
MNSQGSIGPQRLEYQLKDLQREHDVLQKNVAWLEQDLIDTHHEHDAALLRADSAEREVERLRGELERERREHDSPEIRRGIFEAKPKALHWQPVNLLPSQGEGSKKYLAKRKVEIIEITDDEDETEIPRNCPPRYVHMKEMASTEVNRPMEDGTDTKALVTSCSIAGHTRSPIVYDNSKTKFTRRWLGSRHFQIVDGKPPTTHAPHHTKRPRIEGKLIEPGPGAIKESAQHPQLHSFPLYRTSHPSLPSPEDTKSAKCNLDPRAVSVSLPPHFDREAFGMLTKVEEPMWHLSDLSDLSNLTSSDDNDNNNNNNNNNNNDNDNDDDDDKDYENDEDEDEDEEEENEDEDETRSNAKDVASSRRAMHRARHASSTTTDWDSYASPSITIYSNPPPPRTYGPFLNPLSARVAAIPSYTIPQFTPPNTSVSRPFLTGTYSCAARQLLGQIGASKNVPSGEVRHMIWPEMAPNPGLPRARGQPGTVVSSREDMDDLVWRGVKMTLWVKVEGDEKPRWSYFGEYVMRRCKEDLRKEEFCAFSKQSQRKWACILATSMRECFASLAARVWFNKYAALEGPPGEFALRTKTEEIVRAHKQWTAKHPNRRNNPPPPAGLTEDDMLQGLCSGIVRLLTDP